MLVLLAEHTFCLEIFLFSQTAVGKIFSCSIYSAIGNSEILLVASSKTFCEDEAVKLSNMSNDPSLTDIYNFMDQIETHTANYVDLFNNHNFPLFMYFLLGYFQGKTFKTDVEKSNLVFCNMTLDYLSFVILDELDDQVFFYIANQSTTVAAYDRVLKPFLTGTRWKGTENDCRIRENFPHLMICSRNIDRQSIRKLRKSCTIKPVRQALFQKEEYNRTVTKIENRLIQTTELVTKFLQTNPRLKQLHSTTGYLFMILGCLLAGYDDGQEDSVISVGSKQFSFGHVILIGSLLENDPKKLEYTSLRLIPAKSKHDNRNYAYANSVSPSTKLNQIDLDIKDGLGRILDVPKIMHVSTSPTYQTLRLVQHLRSENIDEMLVNLSELFKRLYSKTNRKLALTDDLGFFIGYFLAWRLENIISNIEIGWFEDASDTNDVFLGIFLAYEDNIPEYCLLIRADIFQGLKSTKFKATTGNDKILNSCFLARVSTQKVSGVDVSRICQTWNQKMSLKELVRIGSLTWLTYDYTELSLKNFMKVITSLESTSLISGTINNFTKVTAGFLAYNYDDVEILKTNLAIVTDQSNLILLRDSSLIQQSGDVVIKYLPEKCTKTNLTLIEVDFGTKTILIDDNSTRVIRAKKYCAKQKTTLKFEKNTSTFHFQQHKSVTNKFAQNFHPKSTLDVEDLEENLQKLSTIWSTDKIISMTPKNGDENATSRILLDPMSHQVLLLKSTSMNNRKNLVQVMLHPQRVSKRFSDFEFVSSILSIYDLHNLCPAKLSYKGGFFGSYFHEAEESLLIKKFSGSQVEWCGLKNQDQKRQGFCTSYDFYEQDEMVGNIKRFNLNQIAYCRNVSLAEYGDQRKQSLCSISAKVPLFKTTPSFQNLSTIIIDVDTESNVELLNEYPISGNMIYQINQKQFSRFTLLTPKNQADKFNHQTLTLQNTSLDDIVAIQYSSNENTKVVTLRTRQHFYVILSIENYMNNFAFHVLKTRDNYAIVVHPMKHLIGKIDKEQNEADSDNIAGLVERFTLIWTEPKKFVAYHLSNDDQLKNPENSKLINWVKNDVGLETRLDATKTKNWVLEVGARCVVKNGTVYCSTEPVNIETGTFHSYGFKIITLKALCWKLKEFHAELIITVDQLTHNNHVIVINLIVKSVRNRGTTYLGKIQLTSKSLPLTKVFLELEYMHMLEKVSDIWKLNPYPRNLPKNVRWLLLRPESLVRPVWYKMHIQTTNIQYIRIQNSMVFKISVAIMTNGGEKIDTDSVYVLCYSYLEVGHAFPKIVLEFLNEVYFIEKTTRFRTFY